MTNDITTPGSQAWLAARRNGIGASEAAAVLGLSRYQSPLDIYMRKISEDGGQRLDNAASSRGRRLEPIVLDMYEEAHGSIERNIPRIDSKEYPFMFASLDARRAFPEDRRPVEAKTVGARSLRDWGDESTDEVPQEYLIQVHHQMIVVNEQVADIAAFTALDDFRRYVIERDNELADMIIEAEREFWRRVENREPPPLTAIDPVEKFFPHSRDAAVEATPEIVFAYKELLEVRAAIKPLTDQEEKLRRDIQLFMADRDMLMVNGEKGVTWRTAKPSKRFDTSRFKNDHPDLYEAYLVEGAAARRFLIKGETK